ncbi:hypothetical protein V6N13_034897 [Hibiscus sabdariffa]
MRQIAEVALLPNQKTRKVTPEADGHNKFTKRAVRPFHKPLLKHSRKKADRRQKIEAVEATYNKRRSRYAFDHPDRLSQVMASTALTGMTSKKTTTPLLKGRLALRALVCFLEMS